MVPVAMNGAFGLQSSHKKKRTVTRALVSHSRTDPRTHRDTGIAFPARSPRVPIFISDSAHRAHSVPIVVVVVAPERHRRASVRAFHRRHRRRRPEAARAGRTDARTHGRVSVAHRKNVNASRGGRSVVVSTIDRSIGVDRFRFRFRFRCRCRCRCRCRSGSIGFTLGVDRGRVSIGVGSGVAFGGFDRRVDRSIDRWGGWGGVHRMRAHRIGVIDRSIDRIESNRIESNRESRIDRIASINQTDGRPPPWSPPFGGARAHALHQLQS